MAVIARDTFARDHLVYAWPLPIGPEGCEVACGEDEQVVMCPAWMVGDRLGPGRHHWRTPDPTRPVGAFFVSTSPVLATFDMTTAFMVPNTGMPVRIRATGALQVRCADPGLLIAQFVGLPFDAVNEGILRSVSRSIERMLARLLTRRVIMAGTPAAVVDPGMLPNIVEELVAYNPTAGAVFGIELIAVQHLVIGADDGNSPYVMLPMTSSPPASDGVWREPSDQPHVNGDRSVPVVPLAANADVSLTETAPGRMKSPTIQGHHTAPPSSDARSGEIRSGEIGGSKPNKQTVRHASVPPVDTNDKPVVSATRTLPDGLTSRDQAARAGEILVRPNGPVPEPPAAPALGTQPPVRPSTVPPVEVPRSPDEITQPGVGKPVPTPIPGSLKAPDVPKPVEAPASKARSSSPSIPPLPSIRAMPTTSPPAITSATLPPLQPAHAPMATPPPPAHAPMATPPPPVSESRGAILGIGMSAIGSTSAVAGEIPTKVPPGGRVLVPGPNGLMQSATVRQLLQGYYELEVGSSGETIWVPISNVVPE